MKAITNSGLFITLIAHSFCCVIPFLFFIVGVNSAGYFFESLHDYELYIAGFNFLMIIGGYYLNYHHKKDKNCDHNHCKPDNNKRIYNVFALLSIIQLLYIIWN